MSKRAKITEEMIIDAAFEIARSDGAENVNARRIAADLGCTTQPVLYHFSSILEIKAEVYMRADALFTQYLSDLPGNNKSPVVEFGMQYVKFAASESNLFRLLFQSEIFESKSFEAIMESEGIDAIIDFTGYSLNVSEQRARDILTGIIFLSHGIAGMVANSELEYDEDSVSTMLESMYEQISGGSKGKNKVSFRSFFEKK